MKKFYVVLIVIFLLVLIIAFRSPSFYENYESDGNIILDKDKYLFLDNMSGYKYTGEFDNNIINIHSPFFGFYFGRYGAQKCKYETDGVFIKANKSTAWFDDSEYIYYQDSIVLPELKIENIEAVVITHLKKTVIKDEHFINEMFKFTNSDELLKFPFEKFININDQNDASGYFSVFLKFKGFEYLQYDIGEWILDDPETGAFKPNRIYPN